MIDENEKMINVVKSEKWFNYTNHFNLYKISCTQLLKNDSELQIYCTERVFNHVMSKKNLFISKNFKKLCRKGIPLKFINQILIKMFGTEETSEYDQFHNIVFKEHDTNYLKDYVPYFTGCNTIEESLPLNYLTDNGITRLKEILWILNSNYPNIEFSPMIIKITSLLLIFCNHNETYDIMNKLIYSNFKTRELYKLRWHFRFTYSENKKIILSNLESLNSLADNICADIFIHLKKLNFPIEKLFEDMIFNFFMDYLSIYGVIRILPLFLNEGVKIMYRIIYAILSIYKSNIMKINSSDQVIPSIKTICNKITDFQKLFQIGFSYKLTRNNNKYDNVRVSEIKYNIKNYYHIPKFSKKSIILSKNEILTLWSILPFNLKIKNADIIFTASKDGYHLPNVYRLNDFSNYSDTQIILFLIETMNNEVFGGITYQMIKKTNKFIRPYESYLISIRPEINIYNENMITDYIFYGDDECFLFVNGNKGPAIRINSDISSGSSYSNEYFGSPQLTNKNDFFIKNFEIIILI